VTEDDTLTLSDHLEQTSAATVSRMLREALEIWFDAIDEWDESTLVERETPQQWKSAKHMKFRVH
jgi:hypothetical protein